MVTLGIDPGTTKSAYAILDGDEIVGHGIEDNYELLSWFRGNLFKPEPDLIGCEMIASMGMIVGKEVFETCRWIGRFQEAAKLRRFELIYRKDIKMHLCKTMRSKDTHVRQALLARYGEQGTKKDKGATYGIKSHEWSALAVATFASDRL